MKVGNGLTVMDWREGKESVCFWCREEICKWEGPSDVRGVPRAGDQGLLGARSLPPSTQLARFNYARPGLGAPKGSSSLCGRDYEALLP